MTRNTTMTQAVIIMPLLATLFWQDSSCLSNPSVKTDDTTQGVKNGRLAEVRRGMWGGRHVGMEVTADGASIEYDCARGWIDEAFVVDLDGKFDVRGTHEVESSGPQRAGQSSNARPARYVGVVDGIDMTLTVTLTDKNEIVGTFTLKHGVAPRVVKCS